MEMVSQAGGLRGPATMPREGGGINAIRIIIAIIIAAAAIFVYFWFFPPMGPENQPSQSEYDYVQETLSSGARTDLANPRRQNWRAGDAGRFILSVRNGLEAEHTYYMNIYLSSLGGDLEGRDVESMKEAESWFSYPKAIAIPAGENGDFGIDLRIPAGAEPGRYGFKFIVCTDSDCEDQGSDSLYDTRSVYINVRG